MTAWTPEGLAALTAEQVANVRDNALRKGVSELVALCDQDLAARSIPAKRARRPRQVRDFEDQEAQKLGNFAKSLLARYDLSTVTAKGLSNGVKGFRAHDFLRPNGEPKVGGLQRTGAASLNRYISYRVKGDTAFLQLFLANNQPVEAARYMVLAPDRLLHGARPVSELAGGLVPKMVGDPVRVGREFAELDQAAPVFEQVIAALAPRKTVT